MKLLDLWCRCGRAGGHPAPCPREKTVGVFRHSRLFDEVQRVRTAEAAALAVELAALKLRSADRGKAERADRDRFNALVRSARARIDAARRAALVAALRRAGGVRGRAARDLGIDRADINRYVRRYAIAGETRPARRA